MRIVLRAVAFLAVASAALAQAPSPSADGPVRVHALTIDALGVPQKTLDGIALPLVGRVDLPEIVEERVRQGFRDQGYCYVKIDSKRTSVVRLAGSTNDADVTVHVAPGDRYRLGRIVFERNTVFSAKELRRQFPIRAGSAFNSNAVAKGIENLRTIYTAQGYADLSAAPGMRADAKRRTIGLTIDVDEGKPYRFGRLILDGREPRAGLGKILMSAWKSLEGKPFSPLALKTWLVRCSAGWPSGELEHTKTDNIYDRDSQLMDVRLEFP